MSLKTKSVCPFLQHRVVHDLLEDGLYFGGHDHGGVVLGQDGLDLVLVDVVVERPVHVLGTSGLGLAQAGLAHSASILNLAGSF